MTTVARKNGIHDTSPTNIQSHIDSIHSPHSTRNTIMNECIKSVKFHRGISPSGNKNTRSENHHKIPLLSLGFSNKLTTLKHATHFYEGSFDFRLNSIFQKQRNLNRQILLLISFKYKYKYKYENNLFQLSQHLLKSETQALVQRINIVKKFQVLETRH